MSCSGFVELERYKTVAVAEFEKDNRKDFCWVIKNFSQLAKFPDPSWYSSEFKVDDHSWYIGVIPRKEIDGEEFIAIYLFLEKMAIHSDLDFKENIKANFEVTLWINGRSIQLFYNQAEFNQFDEKGWGWDKFIKCEETTAENDIVKIEVKIWIEPIALCEKYLKITAKDKDVKDTFNLTDMSKILLSGEKLEEMEIKVDGHVFKVQKNILKARSKVFERMLSIPMVENETSSLEIGDFDKEIVQGMIEFIYTGETTISEQNVQKMLEISDKYDLAGLKSNCEVEMIKNLTCENVILVLEMAINYNAGWLRARAQDFLFTKMTEISKTEVFKERFISKDKIIFDLFPIFVNNDIRDSLIN